MRKTRASSLAEMSHVKAHSELLFLCASKHQLCVIARRLNFHCKAHPYTRHAAHVSPSLRPPPPRLAPLMLRSPTLERYKKEKGQRLALVLVDPIWLLCPSPDALLPETLCCTALRHGDLTGCPVVPRKIHRHLRTASLAPPHPHSGQHTRHMSDKRLRPLHNSQRPHALCRYCSCLYILLCCNTHCQRPSALHCSVPDSPRAWPNLRDCHIASTEAVVATHAIRQTLRMPHTAHLQDPLSTHKNTFNPLGR